MRPVTNHKSQYPMDLNVHSIHFDADIKLTEHIRERLEVDQFHDRIVSGEVFLRLDHDSQDRENKVVEVKLVVPGRELFAKRQARASRRPRTRWRKRSGARC